MAAWDAIEAIVSIVSARILYFELFVSCIELKFFRGILYSHGTLQYGHYLLHMF